MRLLILALVLLCTPVNAHKLCGKEINEVVVEPIVSTLDGSPTTAYSSFVLGGRWMDLVGKVWVNRLKNNRAVFVLFYGADGQTLLQIRIYSQAEIKMWLWTRIWKTGKWTNCFESEVKVGIGL